MRSIHLRWWIIFSMSWPILMVGCDHQKKQREAQNIEADQGEAELAQQAADLESQARVVEQKLARATKFTEKVAAQKQLDELTLKIVRVRWQIYSSKLQRAKQIDEKLVRASDPDERATLQKKLDELTPYIDLEAKFRKKKEELEVAQQSETSRPRDMVQDELDTDSADLVKTVDFVPPTFKEGSINSAAEDYLTRFSPVWNSRCKKILDEVSSIQDAQMRTSLLDTKMNRLRSSDLGTCIQEARANWIAYEKKVLTVHANDLMEVESYSDYSPQDEILNSKYKIPVKIMDIIYFKVKEKHLNLIKSRVQIQTQGKIMVLATDNREFTPGGQEHFQESIWPAVEQGVRRDVLVLAYSQPTKELLLIDRQDHEIYFKWEHVALNREDTLLGRKMVEKRKREEESKYPETGPSMPDTLINQSNRD